MKPLPRLKEFPAQLADSPRRNVKPARGRKTRINCASKGRLERFARSSWANDAKLSRLFVSREASVMRRDPRGAVSITQEAYRVTAQFTVTAPGWNRYSGQMSSVPPARSIRAGARASIRNELLPFPQRSRPKHSRPKHIRQINSSEIIRQNAHDSIHSSAGGTPIANRMD